MLKDFISLLFPETCAACGRGLFGKEDRLCFHCIQTLPRTGFHLLRDNPVEKIFWGRTKIHAAAAYYLFGKRGRVQHLVHQIKYRGDQRAGEAAGKLYGRELAGGRFATVDVIVPVPLHISRLRSRGYNQSESFARGLASAMGCPVDARSLIRTGKTETQTRKSRFTRWQNVETTFRAARGEELTGKHVLLVDDVITTGATIEACATVLNALPGTRVSVAAIAWTAH